jgi:DNA-binding LacI/PurR family transcriptional regulator
MAIAALNVVREHGVNVPHDAAIIGFGDGEEAQAANLTTVGVDVPSIGEHAARQLYAQIQGMKIRGITLLATSIIPRET